MPDSDTRVRASVSEDAGSILEAVTVIPVESGIAEAFLPHVTSERGVLRNFEEFLTPGETALQYYPIPTRNREFLSTFSGETKLGRMAHVYPSPIAIPVNRIIQFGGAESITAQQAIDYIFSQWATEFTWFTYEPVPDLRYHVGSDDYSNGEGILRIEAINIPQSESNRLTMRAIVDQWLSVFAGTIIRQNSAGNIELIPRVGPDAPFTPQELSLRDLYDISDGEDDPAGITNRCRVESRGSEFVDDQQLNEPAFVFRSFYEVADSLELSDTRTRVSNGDAQGWAEGVIAASDELTIEYTARLFSVNGNDPDDPRTSHDQEDEVTGTLTLTKDNPSDSFTIEWAGGVVGAITGVDFSTQYTFTWEPASERVRVRLEPTRAGWRNWFTGVQTWFGYYIQFDIIGTAWQPSNETIVSSFGFEATDQLPADAGGDLLTTSVAEWGEREQTIHSDVFKLTPEQAEQIAIGYVLANVEPKTIREVEQSAWSKFPVKFDDVGQLVDLPNGERALVQNRSYSDSFDYAGGSLFSGFSAVVTEVLRDRDTEFLYDELGAYLQDETGEILLDENYVPPPELPVGTFGADRFGRGVFGVGG